MSLSRKKISILTKVFAVFLAITGIDLSLIYVFIGSGQIELISSNGLLLAENAALRIVTETRSSAFGSRMTNQAIETLTRSLREDSLPGLTSCEARRADAEIENAVRNSQVIKAIMLYESERRLFISDLNRSEFSAGLYVPLVGAKGVADTVLVCHLALQSLRESFTKLMQLSLLILGVTLLAQAGLAMFIYRVFIRRLRLLEMATQKVATGDFSGEYKILRRVDEIDQLAERFHEMRVSLAEKTRVLEDTLFDLEKVNFNLEGDLILGEEVQRSILPDPGTGKAITWAVTYRPVGRVSGDFYDVHELNGGATGILQFDASGHGVPAALLTMMAKISFVEAIQKYNDPAAVVAHVNDELSAHLQKTGNFLTVFYGIAYADGRLVYCSAAHTQAIFWSAAGGAQLLDPTSLSVGFAPTGRSAFHNGEIRLQAGDRLTLYTDGVTETNDDTGSQFGVARLSDLVTLHAGKPLAEMHKAVYETWQASVPRSSIDDDVTLLTIAKA